MQSEIVILSSINEDAMALTLTPDQVRLLRWLGANYCLAENLSITYGVTPETI